MKVSKILLSLNLMKISNYQNSQNLKNLFFSDIVFLSQKKKLLIMILMYLIFHFQMINGLLGYHQLLTFGFILMQMDKQFHESLHPFLQLIKKDLQHLLLKFIEIIPNFLVEVSLHNILKIISKLEIISQLMGQLAELNILVGVILLQIKNN